ncbi:hypothetical protein KSF78_0000768 [Schistosoma japonicum]|nr:hypothetical protein KSF78_0000768 [Schistosoma japonicum]KAH8851282.1 hypothetical protein KSF78_0000768 [Schistosoma japonicum]KAH8851284.1 hypothetical protein KSF78_0000768 [Schistosoma japonicum]
MISSTFKQLSVTNTPSTKHVYLIIQLNSSPLFLFVSNNIIKVYFYIYQYKFHELVI